MKKNNKKGFTIVELVIVIAVIAILAAVLIPTFSSVIKKAKVNNDIQLVRNLNTALATDTKEHKTMQSALDAAFEFGYDVAKINNTSVEENEILWDSKNDVFCYLKDGKIEYIPNSVADDDKLSVNSYLLWKISDTVDPTYSTYYTGKATTFTGENAITKGFDAGTTKGITAIEYENNTDQKVVIRTNSFDTTLTINDSSTQGKIYHYNNLGKLIITDCAMESYHEMGIVGYAELQNGHLAVEENASINLLFANPQDSATLKITNNGTITNAQASSDTVKESATISGVDFNRESGATVSDADIQQSVQETHQSNCEHANVVVSKKAKDPTCTETGLTAEESCADCHKVLIAQEEVSATGHNYNNDTHTCTNCGQQDPDYNPISKEVENGILKESAFSKDKTITNAVIPEGVTTIGRYAFYNCTSLESVTIPSTVTKIEDGAFQGCSKLKSVTIPSGVEYIKQKTFYECTALSTVNLPEGLLSIQDYSFVRCSSLSSITIPSTVTTLGQSAFTECTALTSITIPASVTTIKIYVFKTCTSLEQVNLNATITQLPDGIFSGCSTLKTITIPDEVTSIGVAAFQDCRSLASIAIPDKVTSIGVQAFQNCSSLTTITIPDTVTVASIGNQTFENCTSLKTITIPNTVTSIGEKAFKNCTSLTTITIPASVKNIGVEAFYGAGLTTAKFEVTSGWKRSYCSNPMTGTITTTEINVDDRATENNATLLKAKDYSGASFSHQ